MIFEEMKQEINKEAFLIKRLNSISCGPEEYEQLNSYVKSDKCNSDIDCLIKGEYFLAPPRLVMLRKAGSNRRRKVYSFDPDDKSLLQYPTFMMMEKYDDRYDDSLMSFRKKLRSHDLYNAIHSIDWMRTHYVIKTDIHSYGETINTDILAEKLRPFLGEGEKEVFEFIMWLVTRNEFYDKGVLKQGFTSVMSGNPLTNFLENVYMMEVDAEMKKRALVYSRYTDDICVICKDKETAEENLKILRNIVEGELKLEFNEEKTMIVEPGEAYDLLGLKYGVGYVDIADNTYGKVRNRMSHRANKLVRGVRKGKFDHKEAMSRMARTINTYFYYRGKDNTGVSWTDKFIYDVTVPDRLRLLDQFSEDCIRYVGTGRKTNAKYRVRYKDIKELGFKPLVHVFYRRYEEDEENQNAL